MNRSETLASLLDSLGRTNFDGDQVQLHIHIDLGAHREETLLVANRFNFPHGRKRVVLANRSGGLAASWYGAWFPTDAMERGIIFEDDIIVSPEWYIWLKAAWDSYGSLEGLAGITLQRQTLVPYPTMMKHEIVNSNKPFLYPLVGSIGFSPNARLWKDFIHWINTIPPNFDVSTPGLVTSEWWNTLDKRHMWTQHFIYFCLQQGLNTLYVNLPRHETIAAHVRAKGAHYASSQGQDFPTARCISRYFPRRPIKYDLDGKRVARQEARSAPPAALHVLRNTFLTAAKRLSSRNTYVPLVFVNPQSIDTVLKLISRTVTASPEILNEIVFVSTSYSATKRVLEFEPAVLPLTLSFEGDSAKHQGFCRSDFEMLVLQQTLVQEGLSFSMIRHSFTQMQNERDDWQNSVISKNSSSRIKTSEYVTCNAICHASNVRQLQTFYSNPVHEAHRELKATRPDDCGSWFTDFISEAVKSAPEQEQRLLKCC